MPEQHQHALATAAAAHRVAHLIHAGLVVTTPHHPISEMARGGRFCPEGLGMATSARSSSSASRSSSSDLIATPRPARQSTVPLFGLQDERRQQAQHRLPAGNANTPCSCSARSTGVTRPRSSSPISNPAPAAPARAANHPAAPPVAHAARRRVRARPAGCPRRAGYAAWPAPPRRPADCRQRAAMRATRDAP